MLDDIERTCGAGGHRDRLHLERFAIPRADSRPGRHRHLRRSGQSVEVDGATTVLEAGEQAGVLMPFGCRMGICQTCVVPLVSGHIRDLRGVRTAEGERVQTCISLGGRRLHV